MKVLIHNEKRDTTPNAVKVFGDSSSVLVLTPEDIYEDTKDVRHTRGYGFTVVLIPKIFEYGENEILEKTRLWKTIVPVLSRKHCKIVYY